MSDKKKQMNFKLAPKVIEIIKKYSRIDDCTSTNVVEESLLHYHEYREEARLAYIEMLREKEKHKKDKYTPDSYFK
jgi:hypothetical protein